MSKNEMFVVVSPVSVFDSNTGVVITGKQRRQHYLRMACIALLIILLIVGGLFVYRSHDNSLITQNDAYIFSGFGETLHITKSQYDKLMRQSSNDKIATTAAEQSVIDAYKRKLVARHLNLTVNDEDVSVAAKTLYGESKVSSLNDWRLLASYDVAIKNNILFRQNGGYKGTILFFPFNRLFMNPLAGSHTPSGYGSIQAVASDKSYAFEQATRNRQSLLTGKKTVSAVLGAINGDERLEFAGGSNDSYTFYVDAKGHAYLNGESVVASIPSFALTDIKTLHEKGVTAIGTMSSEYSSNVLAPGFSSPAETAYYFVDVTEIISPNSTFSNQFDSAVKNVKVVKK